MSEVEQDARKVRVHLERLFDWAGSRSRPMPQSDLSFIREQITSGLDRLITRSAMLEKTPVLREVTVDPVDQVNTVVLDMRDGTSTTFQTRVSINAVITTLEAEKAALQTLADELVETKSDLARARAEISELERDVLTAALPVKELQENLEIATAGAESLERANQDLAEALYAERATLAELRRRHAEASIIIDETLPANARIITLRSQELEEARAQIENARKRLQDDFPRLSDTTRQALLDCLGL